MRENSPKENSQNPELLNSKSQVRRKCPQSKSTNTIKPIQEVEIEGQTCRNRLGLSINWVWAGPGLSSPHKGYNTGEMNQSGRAE